MNETELRKGGVYRVRARNFRIAVYDGDGGFIGVREKAGSRYLFTEWLAGGGGRGTTLVQEYLRDVPEGIEIGEYEPGTVTTCTRCNQPARWTGPPAPAPWECDGGCADTRAVGRPGNKALFEFLEGMEVAG